MDYETGWRGNNTLGQILREMKDRLTLAKGTFIQLRQAHETRADALFELNGACVQFRYSLELFAFALIEVQKHSAQHLPKSLESELWQVAKIIKALGKRDHSYWPTPVELEIREDRNHFLHNRVSTFEPQDLVALHGRLSDSLHAKRTDIVGNDLLNEFEKIHDKLEAFREYLNQHRYDRDGIPVFVVNMHWGQTVSPELVKLRGAKVR